MGHTQTSERKKDHIDLAFKSVVNQQDSRFFYEPLFSGHPKHKLEPIKFAGKEMLVPIWVSSMTGGTKEAGTINRNLAKACGEFGMGMGLGSCRIILEDDTYLKDFQLRKLIGDYPLFANLGVAQLEELFKNNRKHLVSELVKKTETDGLIIHINPLQEWLQPEGDVFHAPPLETIQRSLELDIPIIVKEVGQGFGPESLKQLMMLHLAAIDFGAHGGTNFSKLEMHRSSEMRHEAYDKVAAWGHSAEEMVGFYNQLEDELSGLNRKTDIIISGGVKDFMDGYYHTERINANAIYGQASAFLKHARGSYEELAEYVSLQIEGLKLAKTYLRLR
ncbi:MAG: isopentenyl-diphosphate delta-isomerase [Bacteroidia bacterium]|nr:isopentenyl-diphosphate delta-isomerase [Bacteroidia bacterium]NNJ54722.1 type 2 isopentenyl-diphosphate Delta-isomerase [Bacteroidia bacterium]